MRADLTGTSGELDKYFNLVKRNELLTGKYLNDIVGLASVGDFTYLDGLAFFIQYIFRNKLVFVNTDTTTLSTIQVNKMREFLRTNAPVSASFVIIPVLNAIGLYDYGLMLDDSVTILGLDSTDGSSVYMGLD